MAGTIFRVLPVLDVLRGEAVHAVRGDRARYQPLRSILHPGHDPLELARACRDVLGLSSLYLADLDAITRGEPNRALYRAIADLNLDLWIDAGLKDADDLAPLLDLEGASIIAGLESLRGPDALAGLLDRAGPERLIVSLDLWNGKPITASPEAWSQADAVGIARQMIDLGLDRVLLLDLTRVGTGEGPGASAESLLMVFREAGRTIEVAIGGGVASPGDVERLRHQGTDAVLIGSALHDGRINRGDLSLFNC